MHPVHSIVCTLPEESEFLSVGPYIVNERVRVQHLSLYIRRYAVACASLLQIHELLFHGIVAIGWNDLVLFQQDVMRKVKC